MPEEGVCTGLCGVRVRHVYIVSDGPASSLQPWAFLPGHQKEFELRDAGGEGAVDSLEKAQCLSQDRGGG